MFVDEATLFIKAGDGGRGCVSFLRTRSNPRGGPDGGDGGKGGDIYVEARPSLHNLLDYLYPRHIKAGNGQHGQGNKKTGAKGKDLIIFLPLGSVITDKNTGEILGDLTYPGEKIKICSGGRRGKGNASFATPTRRAPTFSQSGEKGQERKIYLELKLVAEVGIIGFPNSGKSTLLSALTNATPKIASYPFTTLSPKLGKLSFNHCKITMAEIPGLIEGSSEGKGLGDRFLRHLSRTRALIQLIDMSGRERPPLDEYSILRKEISSYKKDILFKKIIITANKMDLSEAQVNLREFKKRIKKKVIPISAKEGKGLDRLKWSIARSLNISKG